MRLADIKKSVIFKCQIKINQSKKFISNDFQVIDPI
jgi:hypothetical protein